MCDVLGVRRVEGLELLRGVGNLCAGADPRYDARRIVGLLLDRLFGRDRITGSGRA